MDALIGTSGWHYRHWRGGLYPPGLAQTRWLGWYADRFPTVEINGTFYRLPARATFEAWAGTAPEGFVFAVKASRYLTHVRRLRQPEEPVRRLMDRIEGLGSKSGPVLVQLPPDLRADADALDSTLAAFPPATPVAVEFRHASWESPEVRRILERHGAACCLADRDGPIGPWWQTTDWGYARFHGGRASPPSAYGRQALRSAADRLSQLLVDSKRTFIFFNNDLHGCAIANARSLTRQLGPRSPSHVGS